MDKPLKRLLKRWFRELRPLRGSTPETKRGRDWNYWRGLIFRIPRRIVMLNNR